MTISDRFQVRQRGSSLRTEVLGIGWQQRRGAACLACYLFGLPH